ncbi:MAG: hypothetical protein LC687_05470 [Actinobacteria bacterium]|nr:hypothetical protein [Actinomycetota bacterium]MCA1807280.1 hypothetical protein [Actinomycetota bacterium]
MPLKFAVDDINSVDESARNFYVEDNGKYVLDVEGAVPKDKLDEFRNNNIELNNQLSKFKNVDPAKYSSLLELETKVKDSQLVEAGKIDEAVENRVSSLKDEYSRQVEESKGEVSKLRGLLQQKALTSEIGAQASKAGVVDSAFDDVALRAKGVFSVDDEGNLVPLDGKGNVIYGKNGTDPMSVQEWMKGLAKSAPHLFKGSQGGGASNTRSGANTANMSSVGKITAGLS